VSKKLTVHLSTDEYKQVEDVARASRKSVDAWLHSAIKQAIPTDFDATRQLRERSIDAIYEAADDADQVFHSRGVLPLAPQAANQGHPCLHLDPVQHSNFIGQCEGTCRAPSQSGRVCFYTAMAATRCQYYKAKVVRKR
jgi:predicted transcriptional regulator